MNSAAAAFVLDDDRCLAEEVSMAVAASPAQAYKKTPKERAFPVICDASTVALVAVLSRPSPPEVGLRFWAFGRLWQVIAKASPQRGAVAKPVEEECPKSQG